MNRTTTQNAIFIVALLGVMVAGQPMASGQCRYIGSGDYNDLYSVTGTHGWAGCTCPGGWPCTNDIFRVGGDNTVTLTNEVSVLSFQIGVDQSGTLVVESGGKLTTVGTNSGNALGYNGYAANVYGRMTVKTNGVVNSLYYLRVGYQGYGVLTLDGGTFNLSHHLWVGASATGNGTIILTNGGTLNMTGANGANGMLGLGSANGTGPSFGWGYVYVRGGGVLNLYNIDSIGRSIQPGSVLDISGSGVVTFPGDKTSIMTNYYTTTGKITAYGGTGTVAVDYNVSNPGKTTLKAVGGYVSPTDCTWDPVANPLGHGFWNENENWTCHYRPVGITAVIFNKGGVCTVSNAALASYVIMGTNGPGGTLIVTNGGILTCGVDNATVIGYDSNALMVVETGGSAISGNQLSIGLNPGSDGTLRMNGGTVSVAGMFDLGYQGGKGTAQIKGGTLNLAAFDDYASMGAAALLDITGTGTVVLNGDHSLAMSYYSTISGQITNSSGAGLLVDYGIIHAGKTTVYPADLPLAPEQVTWNPALLNASDPNGLWNVSSNWNMPMCPGNATVVYFNVAGAIPCTVTDAAMARYVVMGINGGPGGTLIITNGGSLTTGSDNWTAVGYNSHALMVVENGATVNFGYHLWLGLDPGSDGTFIMNGGTASVAGMFGLGWQGGKGTALINGGTLNLSQWSTSPGSIQGSSVITLCGTGTVVITGNYAASLSNCVSLGKITACGGASLVYSFDPVANKTTIQVAPSRQSITGAAASGGDVTLTCQTTAGHFYHLESTPSLSPATWTRVTGSTTNAAGASVTFTFPTSGDPKFYRTASP